MEPFITRTIILAVIALFAATAQATPISIVNASFESPGIASDDFLTGVPPGWTGATPSVGVTGVIGETRAAMPLTPYGDQWLHLQTNGNRIGQTLGTGMEYLNGTIDLSYIAARRTNEGTNITHSVSIIAGSDLTFVGGTVLDSLIYNTNLPNNGVNTHAAINYTFDLVGSDAGSNTRLWLVFQNNLTGTGQQLMLDGVTAEYTAIVPEPFQHC